MTSAPPDDKASQGVWHVPDGGRPQAVVKGLDVPYGLAWLGDRLYVGHITSPSNGRVTAFEGFDGRAFAKRRVVLDRLAVGENSVGGIVPGPDGRLYVGVGSASSNSGRPGGVFSFSPRGDRPKLEATGLRTAFALALHGRRLLVTDSGRNDLGPIGHPTS